MSKQKISYAASMKELEELVSKIEADEFDVDELSEAVKRAAELIKACKEHLKNIDTELTKTLNELEGE